ncbi:MAG: TonB-dependent receptor [Saprospiraceae bacterium]|nr:TonB-dependent receptor [Saprospiraceae bacterium]
MLLKTKTAALAALLWCALPLAIKAQNITQTLKGVVLDKTVKTPLIGATVAVIPQKGTTETAIGAATDADGRFRIQGVPIGQYTVVVRYLGYKDLTIPNINVNAGKETDLTLEAEESVLMGKEVVIKATVDKRKPLNELAAVSARTFSVEETQKFAAAVNDPARMAASFAGVVARDDGNNTIIIRGNNPNGMIWRMEGVDIPNPNHFAVPGSSGGGISIISAQLLTNSDFLTGAFPAEYGNALSGVFDLKLRKGNADKYEYTVQAGFLGIDVAAEGPMRIGKETGSFLVNYRYSTLSLIGKLGVNIGDAPTNFQDLSFNFWMPAGKVGSFTLFGMGGLSDQKSNGVADSLAWEDEPGDRYSWQFKANTGVTGLTHSKAWDKTFLRSVVAVSGVRQTYAENEYTDDYTRQENSNLAFGDGKVTISSVLNHKFNSRHLLRAGAYANFLTYDMSQREWDDELERPVQQIADNGNTQSVNTFAQWQFRASEKLTISTGLHGNFFLLNQRYAIENRTSVKYAFTDRNSLSFGFGQHAQSQPLGVYFVDIDGVKPNSDLDLTRALHYVLSYDQNLPGNLHVKLETYYQDLYDVPVTTTPSSFSMLNNEWGYVFEKLENTGKGRNYGVELTFEKFLTRGLYFMLSNSLYESEYQGSDGIWRDTRFNGQYANSFVAGKEWNWKRNRTFGVNMRVMHLGGLRASPIDLEASREAGETVRDESRAFEDQMPTYFRLDAGVRLKRNRANSTHTVSLDLQNATNRANVYGQHYNPDDDKIEYSYQAPLIPVLSYKVEF